MPRWQSSSWSEPARRIALVLQYWGPAFHGWQRQCNAPSVQAELEHAITALEPPGTTVRSCAAGRTDRGVHAAGQVAHFDSCGSIPDHRWAAALNGRLPHTIRVLASRELPGHWHACHSAVYRRYRYTIYNGCQPNLFLAPLSWHRYRTLLDAELMASCLRELHGHHELDAFQKAGSGRPDGWTTVRDTVVQRQGDLLVIEVECSGFLYGMMRLLVGQLVALGEGVISADDFRRCWRERRRDDVKEAAPPQGLCLLRVGYRTELFERCAWYDCLPWLRLVVPNPPAHQARFGRRCSP